jgi:hypothetical protein
MRDYTEYVHTVTCAQVRRALLLVFVPFLSCLRLPSRNYSILFVIIPHIDGKFAADEEQRTKWTEELMTEPP